MTTENYALPEQIRDSNGKIVRLGKKKLAALQCVWDEYKLAQAAFALEFNRSNFERLKAAGIELVRLQTFLGVWLVHPDNAKPGLAQDDERIVDDTPALTAEIARLKAEISRLLEVLADYGITPG